MINCLKCLGYFSKINCTFSVIDTLKDLKANILSNNEIFGNNAFIYEDTMSFERSGVSDRYINQMYFRLLRNGTQKYRVKFVDGLPTVNYNVRLIVQTLNASNVLQVIMNNIIEFKKCSSAEIDILSMSDDTLEIYQTEYKNELTNNKIRLVSFDLNITEIINIDNCLCISNNC